MAEEITEADLMNAMVRAHEILAVDVMAEVERQLLKWNEQHHPDGTSHANVALAEFARRQCQEKFNDGTGTWWDILFEEIWEAGAEEPNTEALRTELVQSAAVLISWIRDIDSRKEGPHVLDQ